MFDTLFGWQKASKCKKTLKEARRRLRTMKNRRQAMARQLCEDLAELLQNGHEDIGVKRGEQLFQDESMVAAYELLDGFCELILKQLSLIQRHKECPDADISEAVSSLIFASARCGDIPELYAIRKHFAKRYGDKFVTAAVELSPGNLVNTQLIVNLTVKSVTGDLEYSMVDEIHRDNNCLESKVLAIEYYSDWQQQSQVEEEYKGEEAMALVPYAAEALVEDYVDDIELLKFSFSEDVFFSGQYLIEFGCDESNANQNNKHAMRREEHSNSRRRRREPNKKNSRRRRSVFLENQCLMDIGYMKYYGPSAPKKRLKQHSSPEKGNGQEGEKKIKASNLLDMCDCSLDQPCYCCVYNINQEDFPNVYPRRSLTMPSEWHKNREADDKTLRTYSYFPQEKPKHVHPNLPDCEDIYAMFTALKRKRL